MPLLTPNVPSGLIDLMKNLAKEVLRDKPENIYQFAAVHFEKLIQQRDGSLDKDYEQFVVFQEHFNGQQQFVVPANSSYTCQRPIKIQPILHTKKSKSEMLAGFKAMESINEEDVHAETTYSDEKYQKAIYVIQRFYRRSIAQKKNQSSTTLTATTAAIIIQRTMRRLFANKTKLKTNDEGTAKHDGVVQDDGDNVSEAASYTSSSTIQMLADSQEGRENRLPSGREVVLSDVSGADDDGSTEFKEQTTVAQDAALIPPSTTENSEEADGKSIADENGNIGSIHQDKITSNHRTPALDDDTSTAHIGKLSTIIGSNDQQNSLHTYTVEIDSKSSDPTQIRTPVVAVGNSPQSLGASPNTLPATLSQPHIREKHFAVHLQGNSYAENSAANPYQSVAHVRKFDPNTGESLKIYDVFSQDRDDPDFSDSLNESTMERDSLENEDLDVDSLESNENLTHMSGGIVKREVDQDIGELYGNTNEVHDEERQDVHQSVELERAPTYLYGIHPSRTPIAERKNKRSRNPSAESRKVRDNKDLHTTVSISIDDRTPEERSEEESLESKGSTSEESSVTQIENVSSVAHKIDSTAADGDDLKSCEGASIKIHEVDEVSSGSLQRETLSAGNALAINAGEKAELLVDGGNGGKKDEAFKQIDAALDAESLSRKTTNEKPETHILDHVFLPLVVDKAVSEEVSVENEEALSSKKLSSGFAEVTHRLPGLHETLLSKVEDSGRLWSPSVSLLPEDSSMSAAAGEDALLIDSEAPRDLNNVRLEKVSISSTSDKKSNKVFNSSTENLPDDKGLTVGDTSKIISAQGSLETQRIQKPIEISTKDGNNVHKSTILDEIETTHDQAKTTTQQQKRSLHDTDSLSADTSGELPPLTLESIGNSDDKLTGNIEVSSKIVRSVETTDPSYKGHATNKDDSKVETQASSSNSPSAYFATLYNGHNSVGTICAEPGNHDQQVESQLRELQSLTDLYPGLEIKDVMSEFHTRYIQPDDKGIDKDVVHDDNNNVNAFEMSHFEESRKDQKHCKDPEGSMDDLGKLDEKTERESVNRDAGQPKELQEMEVKEEVKVTKAQTSYATSAIQMNNSKVGTTMHDPEVVKDELSNENGEAEIKSVITSEDISGLNRTLDEDSFKEPKMTEDEVSNKGGKADIKREITSENVSGLKRTLEEESSERLDHKSSKTARELMKLESDRDEEEFKSSTELRKHPTVSAVSAEDSKPMPGKKNDMDKSIGANITEPEIKSENSTLLTQNNDQNVNVLTPFTSSSQLAVKEHEPFKSAEIKPHLKMVANESNIFQKAHLAVRTEPKQQEEDYFGNTIVFSSKPLSNDNPVIEVLKADGLTLKTAAVKLPKVEEEPHDYVRDNVQNIDSDKPNAHLLSADKLNLTDAQTNSKVSILSESGVEPKKAISSSEIGSPIANEGTMFPNGRKDIAKEHKFNENQESVPKSKGEGNSKTASEGIDNKVARSDSSETKDEYRIENELTSSEMSNKDVSLALTKSEKHVSTDIQHVADLEMSKPSDSTVEHQDEKTGLYDGLRSYEDSAKEENKNDTQSKNSRAVKSDSLDGEEKYRVENELTASKIPKRDDGLDFSKSVKQASTIIQPVDLEALKLSQSNVEHQEKKTGLPDHPKNYGVSSKEGNINDTQSNDNMAVKSDSVHAEEKYRESMKQASTIIKPVADLEASKLSQGNVEYQEEKAGLSGDPKTNGDSSKEGNKTETQSKDNMTVKSDSLHAEKKYGVENELTSSEMSNKDVSLALTKSEKHASTDIQHVADLEMSKPSDSTVEHQDEKTGLFDGLRSYEDSAKEENKNDTQSKNSRAVKSDSLDGEEKYRVENELTASKIPKRDDSLDFSKSVKQASTIIQPVDLEASKHSQSNVEHQEEKTGLPDDLQINEDNIKMHKSNENQDSFSKRSEDENSVNYANYNDKVVVREDLKGISISEADKKHIIDSELTSNRTIKNENHSSLNQAEYLNLTDTQTAAGMSKHSKSHVEPLKDISSTMVKTSNTTENPGLTDGLQNYNDSVEEHQDSTSKRSGDENRKNDDGKEKMDDNFEQMKGSSSLESGNDRLVENLPTSSKIVPSHSSFVKQTSDEMEEIKKPCFIQGAVTADSRQSIGVDDILAEHERELRPHKNGSAELKAVLESSKELKHSDLATANEEPLLLDPEADKSKIVPIDSLENTNPSLQNINLQSKTNGLEQNSKLASTEDKALPERKPNLGLVEQLEEYSIGVVSKESPKKEAPGLELLDRETNECPSQTNDEESKNGMSSIAANIPKSGSEGTNLGLVTLVSETALEQGNTQHLNNSSEVPKDIQIREKLDKDHKSKTHEPRLANIAHALEETISNDSLVKLGLEVPTMEVSITSHQSDDKKSGIVDHVLETNVKEKITLTNLPKTHIEPKITEDHIKAVSEVINKSEADQVDIEKQIEVKEPIKEAIGNIFEQLDSIPSSVSVPTELTSCDDSNAETSADISSIGKDLDFFEDTINYLKSATAQLTMDDIFTEDEKKRESGEGSIDHFADVESDVTPTPGYGSGQALDKTKNRSSVVEGVEAAEAVVLDQAATVIQSAVRGYRVRRDLNRKVKQSAMEDLPGSRNIDSKERPEDFKTSETHIIKHYTPTGVAHPIFVIHPTVDVSGEELASKEEPKPLNTNLKNKETEVKVLEQDPGQIDSESKNPDKPDNIASQPTPPGIALEEPTQRVEKSVKAENLNQSAVDSVGSVQQIRNQSNEAQQIKPSISREKPIERKSKPIKSNSLDETKASFKSDSFDKPQMKSPPGRTKIPVPENKNIAVKHLKSENDKHKSKVLRSKVPSTSNLLERDRSAKSKRNQFGRKVRSVSVKEQNQKTNVFDLEAIKNDLLSTKKVKSSSKNSGQRTKMPQRNANSPIKVSNTSKSSTNSIDKYMGAKRNTNSKVQQASGKGNSDKIDGSNDLKSSAVKSDTNVLFDELNPATNESTTVEISKNNIDSSQQISATTIQKTFRGFRTRKHLKSVNDQSKGSEMAAATEETFNTVSAMDGANYFRRQTEGGNFGIFDTLKGDVEDFKNTALDKSATKIQKTFRGFRTRKGLKDNSTKVNESPRRSTKKSDVFNSAAKTRKTLVEPHLLEEVLDQKERKKIKEQDDFGKLKGSSEDTNEITLHTSATTIQKNFRGYKTRKNLRRAKSFESISGQTFIIKSKSKETIETLNGNVKSVISTEENLQKVSPKIDNESSGIFENIKRDMDSFKKASFDRSAIQIQKIFRGYKTRKYLKDDSTKFDKSPGGSSQISDQKFPVESIVSKTENETQKDSRKTDEQMSRTDSVSSSDKAEIYTNNGLDESAKTIQKTFRGYKTRKGLKNGVSKTNNDRGAEERLDDPIVKEKSTNVLDDDVKTQITLNKEIESMLKVKDDNSQADDLNSDVAGSPALDKFATTIQKTFRRFKARKEMMAKDVNSEKRSSDTNLVQLSNSGNKSDKMLTGSQPHLGEVDQGQSECELQKVSKRHEVEKSSSAGEIPFNEVSEKAAVTIQKTYKGFKARKELQAGDKLKQIDSKLDKSEKTEQPLSKNSQKSLNSENSEHLSENSAATTKVDTEDSTKPEREYTHSTHRDEIAPDEPAKRSTLTKHTTRAASAGALLGAAASTIQKAFRDYHSRKESTISKIKSYSHGAQRDNAPKEIIDTSDESSTFIGPDTSFDLSDIDSVGTKSTPTLEFEISNSPSFALSIHSEGHDIENECCNAALVSENSLSVSPQRILRKRSIMDATAPLLVDILNIDKSTDSNDKPQWYVGEDLIVPSIATDPPTFQNPLASSSSFDKLSSIDSRSDSFISTLQPTPSINSAVVSTSSLLFDTKDTEMHDTIKNTPTHLNKHSRAVSANEEGNRTEKEAEVKNEENNSQEVDKGIEKTESQNVDEEDVFEKNGAPSHGLTDLEESLMITNTDPFSPRNAIEDVKEASSQAIVTELCKNCADGVHEVHEEDVTKTSTEGKLPQPGLSDKTKNQAVNVEYTKDVSQSTDKHFDDIKQFVLMEEEQKTTQRSSENDDSKKVNKTDEDDTETTAEKNVQDLKTTEKSSENDETKKVNKTDEDDTETSAGKNIQDLKATETSSENNESKKVNQTNGDDTETSAEKDAQDLKTTGTSSENDDSKKVNKTDEDDTETSAGKNIQDLKATETSSENNESKKVNQTNGDDTETSAEKDAQDLKTTGTSSENDDSKKVNKTDEDDTETSAGKNIQDLKATETSSENNKSKKVNQTNGDDTETSAEKDAQDLKTTGTSSENDDSKKVNKTDEDDTETSAEKDAQDLKTTGTSSENNESKNVNETNGDDTETTAEKNVEDVKTTETSSENNESKNVNKTDEDDTETSAEKNIQDLKTTEKSSENNESKNVNEINGDDTETSTVKIPQKQGDTQMLNSSDNDGQIELPLVTVKVNQGNVNDDDSNVGPSIALIPPSSEEETSDQESTHELEISQSGQNTKDRKNNVRGIEDEKQLEESASEGADSNEKGRKSEKHTKDEENNVIAAKDEKQLEKSPSKGADSKESVKNSSEKQKSVDICQEIVTVKSDEVTKTDVGGSVKHSQSEEVACDSTEYNLDDKPRNTQLSLNDGDLKAFINEETKIEVDSTELKKNQTSPEVDAGEYPPTSANSKNLIDVQQKSEDILEESATVKSHELNLDCAVKLSDIETNENTTTTPIKDNKEKNENVAVVPAQTKTSLENGNDVKEEFETIKKTTSELNYTEIAEISHPPSNTVNKSQPKEPEDSKKTVSVDKLKEHCSEISSNIANPPHLAEKSEHALKKKTNVDQQFEDDFIESSNNNMAVDDPIKHIEISHLLSGVSEDTLTKNLDIVSDSNTGDSRVVNSNSLNGSSKEENRNPVDVELLEQSKLKRAESSHKDDSSNDLVQENMESNTGEDSNGSTDLEPKALSEEGEVQIGGRAGINSEEKTALNEAASDFSNNELSTSLEQPSTESNANHKTSSKDADSKSAKDESHEVKSKNGQSEDPNPKSTHERVTPMTEHEATDSKEVVDIKNQNEVPLPPNDSAEDLEIASKLLERHLSKTDTSSLSLEKDKQPSVDGEPANVSVYVKPSLEDGISKQNSSNRRESLSDQSLTIQANLEKLIDESVSQIENDANSINPQDLPIENSPNEVVEVPCVKKVLPLTPLSATSDQDESELESTTTKAESTTTSPGYDGASDNDALEIPHSLPDSLEAMAEKLRETEEMVARMHQRRASEHKISSEIADQPLAFEDRISEPIRPMRELQKSSSTEVEDDIILQKLQRGNTTRESSAQSESVVFGDSTSQLTESEDTFNESPDVKALHRMNTIAVDRNSYKPSNLLHKSVTIDDTVKYIDPEKSTEESGGSFCLDDAISADVRKKMMAYSISEADSDYYDAGERTARLHDDFSISTALDTFPSSDTDTTIVSAATKIQAGARGFLTRRKLRRASMGTKSSLNEETMASFGNDAIAESLDRLVEEEDGKRKSKVQYHRQVGVNSLPSAMGNSTETETPSREQIHADDDSGDLKLAAKLTSVAEEIITKPHGDGSSIDGQRENHNLSTASDNDVNGGQEADDESAQLPPNLEATLAARRLTLQRGDAMRNDSTPDDDNGNTKQVDPAKSIPAAAAAATKLIHQTTMVESTTMGTTLSETTIPTSTTTTTERRNYSDAAMTIKMDKVKWFAMRQNSMPVQIDSEVFRVLPKHMRKRIKSAEGEQKKRIRLPRD